MSTDQDNKRETGARKYPAVSADTNSEISQDAALPNQKKPYGWTESAEDTEEKTRHSDGQSPSRPRPARIRKRDLALARRSLNIQKMPRHRRAAASPAPTSRSSRLMQVANLQLQGLLMAVASINNVLVHKGILRIDEVDMALRTNLTGEERPFEDMSPANRDVACFPIRFLQAANNALGETEIPSFSELARVVGQTNEPYSDQQ